MNRFGIVTLVCVLGLMLAPAAPGAPPENPDCWGAASADLARSAPGALGDHAVNPPPIDLTPDRPGRAGIGNVARALGGDHPSDAAALLGFACP
ncbi:MAG TPA: hypothetical protein VK896_13335 [Gaiellaceae bacterium]|nr:hypothetical protein [Gaiellaceae bacterium]